MMRSATAVLPSAKGQLTANAIMSVRRLKKNSRRYIQPNVPKPQKCFKLQILPMNRVSKRVQDKYPSTVLNAQGILKHCTDRTNYEINWIEKKVQ
jgi:hypothetical protein